MQLENYFEFLNENDIRLKGTRVGIETVLDDYLTGSSPEEIAARYLSLSLEQVYATVTYYLSNRFNLNLYLNARRQPAKSEDLDSQLRERIKNHQRTAVAEAGVNYQVAQAPTSLEDYFDFLSEDDIRIKGTRIGIETVLDDYLEGASPEEIAARYRSLSLEKVYATLTYYWRNQAKLDVYLEAWRQYTDQAYAEWQRNPSEEIKRLRHLK